MNDAMIFLTKAERRAGLPELRRLAQAQGKIEIRHVDLGEDIDEVAAIVHPDGKVESVLPDLLDSLPEG